MVPGHSDAGAAQWLADRDIALVRGRACLAETGVVDVDGVSYTAEQVVADQRRRSCHSVGRAGTVPAPPPGSQMDGNSTTPPGRRVVSFAPPARNTQVKTACLPSLAESAAHARELRS